MPDRLDPTFQRAEKRRAVGAESRAWAKCGAIERPTSKKPSKIRPDVVAPTESNAALVASGCISMIQKSAVLLGLWLFRSAGTCSAGLWDGAQMVPDVGHVVLVDVSRSSCSTVNRLYG